MYLTYAYHFLLKKIFKFNKWHLSSYRSRPYCLDLIDYINSVVSSNSKVVEIGCGLGDNLSKINTLNKSGYDIDQNVIKAAKFKYFFSKIRFKNKNFTSIKNLNIDFLITVNFLHNYSPKQVENLFRVFLSNNNVNCIIIDKLNKKICNGYKYYHDYKFLEKFFFIKNELNKNNKFGRSILILQKKI